MNNPKSARAMHHFQDNATVRLSLSSLNKYNKNLLDSVFVLEYNFLVWVYITAD